MSTGHPSKHGFVRCLRCGHWIRRDTARIVTPGGLVFATCADVEWCEVAARVERPLEPEPSP